VPTRSKLIFYRGQPNPISGKNRTLYLLRRGAAATEIEVGVDNGVSLPSGRSDPTRPFHLKVLHFNDLHGWICDIHHRGARPIFSRLEHEIKRVRAKCAQKPDEGLLVVSAGDDIIGTVFDQLLGEESDHVSAHPGYKIYSAAGVDACCLGNHDLDLGFDPIRSAIQRDAAFPVLAANLRGPDSLSEQCPAAALYVIKGVRIGLIGLTTPAEHNLSAGEIFEFEHPVDVARRLVPELRPLCDVLIVLSHLGYSLRSNPVTVQMAGDIELAEALPQGSVDLIVGGHTHDVLNEKGMSASNIVNGIPIVQAGMLGRFLGLVDIVVEDRATVTNARLLATETLPVDRAFERKYVRPFADQAISYFETPLGKVCRDLDVTTEAVRNSFAAGESAFANFICDAMVARCQRGGTEADLAILDSSSVRAGLPTGRPVSYGDWFNIMPFSDTIWILKMTGQELKSLIEDNALRTDRPGFPHTERGFLHFSSAIRYRIILGNDRASAKALDIAYRGKSLEDNLDHDFRVACSSFIRVPAGPWETIARQTLPLTVLDLHSLPKETTGLFMRQEIVSYIQASGGVTAQAGVRRDGRLLIQ